jgi:two-component system, chemotaxis family, chemotaxis protein CheY
MKLVFFTHRGHFSVAKILIVDDAPSARASLKKILEGAGHFVLEADSGLEGVKKVLEDPKIDLLVTDLNMPDINGLSMLTLLKEKLGGFRFPVVVATADSTSSERAKGKELGVTAWLIKPFKEEALLNAVAAIVK